MKLKLVLTMLAVTFIFGIIGQAAQASAGKKQKVNYPPHYNGWVCIHNREGAWNDDTGNGYYGGLQMTYNWMGVIPGKANWLSPLAQMWAAERVAAQNNFSYSFMRGQWPNTFPPCAGFFR